MAPIVSKQVALKPAWGFREVQRDFKEEEEKRSRGLGAGAGPSLPTVSQPAWQRPGQSVGEAGRGQVSVALECSGEVAMPM